MNPITNNKQMKKHLLRTLVVALMTMIGGNAWADNYFTQDYEGDGVTADWTSGNTGRYTVDMKATEDPANNYLTVNAVGNGNNGATITSTSVAGKVANDKDFTMEFDLQITNGNNQASSFYVYDSANDASKAFFALVAPSTGTKWNIQGSADHQVELAKNTWYTFKIAKSAGITYLTLTDKATGDKLEDQAIIPTLSEAGGLGNMVFNTKRYYAYMAIDNVVVRDVESTDAPASTPTTYTLKYVDGNSTALKEDVIINSIVGIEVAASSDQIADFKTGEGDNQKKWIYVSGNNSITTVEAAESNVITLVYREAGKFSYTFTAKSGDLLLETYPVATGFELDNIKVPYHHYYFTGGKIYQKGATSSEYNYSFILDSNNKEVGINDYAILEKDNVIFFAEAENLKALTPITDGLQASRNSFAAGAFASEYVPFITLAPGTYTLTAAGYGGTYSFMNGETSVLNMEQAGYWREITSEEFTLETSTDITFKGGVGATGALDYIYIQSTNGSAKEYEKPFDPATAIVNADFSADEPIAQKICTYAKDVQEGQVAQMQPLTGWTIAENGDARAAGTFAYGSTAILGGDGGNVPAAGPNGETEGKALGLEAVWSATAKYTQDVTLPAGEYLFEAVIYNAAGTGALSQNLIGIDDNYCTTKNYPVGKWTKEQVKFTLAEEKSVTISLGINSGNVGNGSAPHLFIDHIKLYGSDEIAAIELAAAKEKALAAIEALPAGEGLFYYSQTDIDNAKTAVNAAETVEAVAAVAMPTPNAPAADKAYAIANATATGNLCITEGKVSVAKDAKVFFTAVEGGYVLSNEAGDYIFKTDNDWTLSTTKEIASAYVVTIVPVEGGYTIKGAKGLFGLDSTDEGSTVYANKAQSNNGLWTIAEYVAPSNDYTSYIVNADLTGEGGFDATGTKGIDGSGIVKVGSAAAFDFKQTIANLPAGKYKVTAQAAYRYGADEAAEAAAIAAETDTKLVQLYATVGEKTVSAKVQNRYDGASETDYANGNGSVTVNEKFVPNSSDAVKAWFAAGQYVNEVIFNLPADGAVTIGINRTGTPESDYTVIGPWTLTRLGDAEAEPEPEPEPQPGQDMTKYITNPSFETGNTNGWTYETSNDHGAKRNDNGTYTMTNCDGDYLFNIWSSGNAISQKIENLPNGTYLMKAVIATDANQQVQLNANGKSIKIDAVGKETGVEGELEFDVLNNTATIGAEGVNKYWYKVDNFRLTFVKGFDIAALKDIYKTALAEAQAITGNMSAEAKLALTAAIAVEVDTTEASSLITAANTLTEAAATANASVAAYAKAKAAIDAAKAEMAATNVYTTEALEAYKAVYDAAEPKYENGTMTDEEAKALENPTTITGWHDATIVDNFLLSAWDTNPDFQDAPYYINTWSTEGNNDGSNFKVPFFEYWTSDANSLGAKALTATMNSLPAGDYDISAWVRVRIKNGAEAPATGITLQANEGEAVNVAAGDQIGTSQFYLKEFTATGTVAEDGVLKIKFNVAADNNISWLSFKNVKFEKKPFKPEAIEGALYSWESPEGLPGEYGGKISYVNGVDNRLNYQNSGYYTICLNGKKANMNDTIAKADASYMLVTLDEALSEGDTIYITAYVNKNASKKASAYILFDNGADVESPVYSDEANIDTLFNGVPTEKSIIVTEAMAGAKSFKMTRGQTGTNLFITKFVIMKKKSEPVEPAKYEYNGYVTIARIAQNNVLGDVTSETQKVTITETEDKAIVAVTFSGFETFPEFTFNANVTGGDSVTYTVAEGSKVNVQQGQMAIEYNLTGNGTQASTEAIPTIALQMSQNPAMTINVVFAATAEEAKASLLKTTGIINIARDAQKNVIYNINGQKVNKAQKGLFIINGKKVVNK